MKKKEPITITILMLTLAFVFLYAFAPNVRAADRQIPDGVYRVQVDMWHDYNNSNSMGNAALRGSRSCQDGTDYKALLVVDQGEGTVIVEYVPMIYMGTYGFLLRLDKAQDDLKDTIVLSEYRKTDGTITMDYFNDPSSASVLLQAEGKAYPHVMAVSVGKIPADGKTLTDPEEMPRVEVFVPVMESIGSGSGTQNARIKVDYDAALIPEEILSADVEYWLYKAIVLSSSSKASDKKKELDALIAETKEKLSDTVVQFKVENGKLTKDMKEMTDAQRRSQSLKLRKAMDALKGTVTDDNVLLAEEKQNALKELKNYRDEKDYREQEKGILKELLSKAETDIHNAEDIEIVYQITADTKTAIAKLKTEAGYAADEAASYENAKNDAMAQLQGFMDRSDEYPKAELRTLRITVSRAQSAIQKAATVAEIESVLNNALTTLNGLKTKAQYEEEEKKTEQKEPTNPSDQNVNSENQQISAPATEPTKTIKTTETVVNKKEEKAFVPIQTTEKPVKVTGLKVKNMKGKKVVLTWKRAKNASGYVVYRSLKKNKGFKAITTIKKGKTVKYTDKKLKKGKVYYYKILSYRLEKGKKIFSPSSKTVKVKIKK